MKTLHRIIIAAIALSFAASAFCADLTVQWDNNSTATTGFYIERSADGVTFAKIAETAVVTQYRDTGLKEITTFFYRVQAFARITGQAEIKSAYSNTASGQTLLNAPSNARTSQTVVVNLSRGQTAYIVASK